MHKKLMFETKGNVELLSQKRIAVFASKNTPAELFRAAEELFDSMSNLPLSIAGGWQAPLEKSLLQRADSDKCANYIIYLAQNISNFKLSLFMEKVMTEKKLLIVSPGIHQARASAFEIKKRDKLIFTQIKTILFLYISPGGMLEKYFNELSQLKYHIFVLDHPLNHAFFTKDSIPVNQDNIEHLLGERKA